jgi:hypothetical protein
MIKQPGPLIGYFAKPKSSPVTMILKPFEFPSHPDNKLSVQMLEQRVDCRFIKFSIVVNPALYSFIEHIS